MLSVPPLANFPLHIAFFAKCSFSLLSSQSKPTANSLYSAEEIVDTNVKLVLGLLWTLYRKYRIAVIQHHGRSAEEGLLLWIKETTKDYKGVNIEKWNNSFSDGLAYLALVHAFDPQKSGVKYDSYDPANKKENLEAAFDFAEKELGIPKLLDANEVASGTVDERSLVLYASLFFHAYRALKEREALEEERRRKEAALEEEQRSGMALDSDNKKLWEQIENLNLQIKDASEDRDELLKRSKKFNKLLDTLKSKDEELSAEKDRLRAEIAELEKKLADLKAELEGLLAGMSDSQKELSHKLNDAAGKASKLQEAHAQLEVDLGNFKSQIEDLESDLKRESAEREAREKDVEQNKYRNQVMLEGLGVMKVATERQVDDVNRWKNYVEYDKSAKIDFTPKSYNEEIKGDYLGVLEGLAKTLQAENQDMINILAAQEEKWQKAEEEKAKKEAKAKAKAKQAKQAKSSKK